MQSGVGGPHGKGCRVGAGLGRAASWERVQNGVGSEGDGSDRSYIARV